MILETFNKQKEQPKHLVTDKDAIIKTPIGIHLYYFHWYSKAIQRLGCTIKSSKRSLPPLSNCKHK